MCMHAGHVPLPFSRRCAHFAKWKFLQNVRNAFDATKRNKNYLFFCFVQQLYRMQFICFHFVNKLFVCRPSFIIIPKCRRTKNQIKSRKKTSKMNIEFNKKYDAKMSKWHRIRNDYLFPNEWKLLPTVFALNWMRNYLFAFHFQFSLSVSSLSSLRLFEIAIIARHVFSTACFLFVSDEKSLSLFEMRIY